MNLINGVVLSLLISTAAHAAPAAFVTSCGELNRIENLKGTTKAIGQDGYIRAARISTDEPVSASEHLLLLIGNDEGSVDCYAVSATDDGLGYREINMPKIKTASYDAKKGRLITVPVSVTDGDGNSKPAGLLKVRVNLSNIANPVTIE